MKVTMRVMIGELVLRNSELDRLEVVQELGQHATCRIEFIRDSATDEIGRASCRERVSPRV